MIKKRVCPVHGIGVDRYCQQRGCEKMICELCLPQHQGHDIITDDQLALKYSDKFNLSLAEMREMERSCDDYRNRLLCTQVKKNDMYTDAKDIITAQLKTLEGFVNSEWKKLSHAHDTETKRIFSVVASKIQNLQTKIGGKILEIKEMKEEIEVLISNHLSILKDTHYDPKPERDFLAEVEESIKLLEQSPLSGKMQHLVEKLRILVSDIVEGRDMSRLTQAQEDQLHKKISDARDEIATMGMRQDEQEKFIREFNERLESDKARVREDMLAIQQRLEKEMGELRQILDTTSTERDGATKRCEDLSQETRGLRAQLNEKQAELEKVKGKLQARLDKLKEDFDRASEKAAKEIKEATDMNAKLQEDAERLAKSFQDEKTLREKVERESKEHVAKLMAELAPVRKKKAEEEEKARMQKLEEDEKARRQKLEEEEKEKARRQKEEEDEKARRQKEEEDKRKKDEEEKVKADPDSQMKAVLAGSKGKDNYALLETVYNHVKNTANQKWDIYDTRLHDTGATIIGIALKQSTVVTYISICWCNITAVGAKVIGDALKTNQTLTELWMGCMSQT